MRVARSRGVQLGLAIVVATPLLLFLLYDLGGPDVLVERYGLWAPVISLLVHVVTSLSPVDIGPWGILNGAAYGLWSGALLSGLAWQIAGIVEFLVARRTAADFDLSAKLNRLPRWVRGFPADHPVFLICGRWLPTGGPVVSVAAGAFGVRFSRFFWCGLVSATPPAILLAGVGSGLWSF